MEGEPWYIGRLSRDAVEDEFASLRDGSFAVFQCETDGAPDKPNYTLVVKVDWTTEYKAILSEDDGLFGFIEPMTFESIGAVLEAYNDSPTEIGGRLVYPGLTYKSGVIDLLKRLIYLTDMKSQQTTDLTDRKWRLHDLEKELGQCSRRQQGYTAVEEMLKNQTAKHKATESRTAYLGMSSVFSENYDKIVARRDDLKLKQAGVEAEMAALRAWYTRVSADYSHSLEAVHDLHRQQGQITSTLPANPKWLDYADCLMSDTDDDLDIALKDTDRWLYNDQWQERHAERLLAGKPDGTFLVSPSQKYPNVPYILSVAYESPKLERRVHYFSVFRVDDYLGLQPSMCIFEHVTGLVRAFGRIPFRVVDNDFSLLTLTFPVIDKQHHGTLTCPAVSVIYARN